MGLHDGLTLADIHALHRYAVADTAALNALSLTVDDEGCIAWQQDTDEIWFLVDFSIPTWVEMSSLGTTQFTGLTDTPANFTSAENKLVRVNSTPDALEWIDETVVLDTGELEHTMEDAVTAAITNVAAFGHNSSGTPAAYFGVGVEFRGESATVADRVMGEMGFNWFTATDASRKSMFRLTLTNAGSPVEAFVLGRSNIASPDGDLRSRAAVDLQSYRTASTQVASGVGSVLIGGYSNTASGIMSIVLSGYENLASARYGVAAGYRSQATGWYGIAMGQYNVAGANKYTVAIGGHQNTASGTAAGVFVGHDNTASGPDAAVVAGYSNTASGNQAFVAGGYNNDASGDNAGIVSGFDNTVSANYGVILGGHDNTVSGRYGVIAGRNSVVSSYFGVAIGAWAEVANTAGLAMSGGQMNAAGDAQFQIFTGRRTVTHSDASWYALHLDGSNAAPGSDDIGIKSDTRASFFIFIDGATSGATKSFSFIIYGSCENDGGTLTIKSQTQLLTDDADDVSFDARVAVSGTDLAVEVQDSDGASDVVKWHQSTLMNVTRSNI